MEEKDWCPVNTEEAEKYITLCDYCLEKIKPKVKYDFNGRKEVFPFIESRAWLELSDPSNFLWRSGIEMVKHIFEREVETQKIQHKYCLLLIEEKDILYDQAVADIMNSLASIRLRDFETGRALNLSLSTLKKAGKISLSI